MTTLRPARIPPTILVLLLLVPTLSAAAPDRDAVPPPVVDPVSAFPDDNVPDLGGAVTSRPT